MLMATLHPTQVQSESLGGTQALVLKKPHTHTKIQVIPTCSQYWETLPWSLEIFSWKIEQEIEQNTVAWVWAWPQLFGVGVAWMSQEEGERSGKTVRWRAPMTQKIFRCMEASLSGMKIPTVSFKGVHWQRKCYAGCALKMLKMYSCDCYMQGAWRISHLCFKPLITLLCPGWVQGPLSFSLKLIKFLPWGAKYWR